MTDDVQIQRLRIRAHEHTDLCYGRYEPCGEHHMHDMTCGNYPLLCGTREDEDLVRMFVAFDAMAARVTDLATAARDLVDAAAHCRMCRECGDGPCCGDCQAEAVSARMESLLGTTP